MMSTHRNLDISQVSVNLENLRRQAPALVEPAIRKMAIEIVARAKQLAPIDTGDLRRSIGMRMYGDMALIFATMEYAAAVHEDLTAHHDEGTGAKFIEIPLREVSGTMAQEIARKVIEEIQGII